MKRTVISGLLVATALLASPVFAADDLCTNNLQKINDNMATAQATSEGYEDSLEMRLQKAKDAQAKGDTKECIAITSKIISRMEKTDKGGY